VARSIHIAKQVSAQLVKQARRSPALECCGLLAGRDGTITRSFPAVNAASDPAASYDIAPEELFRLMREMRAAGLELLGIYHSHPNGRNEPSASDVERAYYPDAAYFIISPREDAAQLVRAFSIHDGRMAELAIEIT
jgi:proteasome lid subunit RPN8/RPN11